MQLLTSTSGGLSRSSGFTAALIFVQSSCFPSTSIGLFKAKTGQVIPRRGGGIVSSLTGRGGKLVLNAILSGSRAECCQLDAGACCVSKRSFISIRTSSDSLRGEYRLDEADEDIRSRQDGRGTGKRMVSA